MEIALPAIPAGVMTLIAFFAPFAIALVNSPKWSTGSKQWISLAVSVALAILSLGGYYLITGDAIPSWPMLILLFIIVAQASYALVLKKPATVVEKSAGVK